MSEPEQQSPEETTGEKMLSLRIGTLNSTSSSSDEITEKIKSLRIIILSDGFIEYNQKFDYSQGEPKPKNDGTIETLKRATVAGNKKFYLIANEESVPEIHFDGKSAADLPEGISDGKSLSDFLNHFTKDKLPSGGTLGFSNSGTGNKFEELINSAYFIPDYTISDNTVYLPYTSYYDGITADDNPEVVITENFFLVPVATKFSFNFKNFRRNDVKVEGFSLRKFNSSNYLFAKLDETEQYKTLDNESYYWINWLEAISRDSQTASDLNEYNKRVGWIQSYSLPSVENESIDLTSQIESIYGLKEKQINGTDDWVIEKLIDKNNPDELIIPALYYPESRNIITKTVLNESTETEEEIRCQGYYVQFRLREIQAEEIETTDWIELDMLPFLFRNTHLNVNIELQEKFVTIYCEINPWNFYSFKGYVQEEDN